MRPIRTAKTAAKRVDKTYVQRPRRGPILLLTVLALAASVGWWVLNQTKGDAAIYSPGRVAPVHAALNDNCAECHDGDGRGGFTKHVSDSACLKCHSMAATAHSVHQSTMVKTVSLGNGTHALRAAECADCHVDHRGHAALLDRSDDTCIRCHKDIAKFTDPKFASHAPLKDATVFATATHPAFGRELIPVMAGSTGAMQDPTPLQFGHKTHLALSDIQPLPGETEKCTVCHEPPPTPGMGVGVEPAKLYMRPVSFERHCAGCHGMSLGTNMPIPHESFELVRPFLEMYANANTEDHFKQVFAAMSKEQQQGALMQTTTKPGPPPLRKPITVTEKITPEQWISRQADPFWGPTIEKWFNDNKDQYPTAPAKVRSAEGLEFYVLHNKSDKCAFCHQLTDDDAAVKSLHDNAGPPLLKNLVVAYRQDPPVLPDSPVAAKPIGGEPPKPTTLPSASPTLTLPTGISSRPRRWYVNSVFDHSQHRFTHDSKGKVEALSCTTCHAKALASDTSTDVLLPGIENCVTCHHPPTQNSPGAVVSCLACHPFYHDRSMESILPAPTLSAMAAPPPTATAQP
jgi:hypothetical protein